jgi:pimeloyl-ACP methyl ester carboxylesterase
MWETWAPQDWFSEPEFEMTAKSFENPDWPDVTVHSYRVRWAEADKDPRYAALDAKVHETQSISVPTLMIQGGADGVTLAETTAGKGPYFTGGYTRHELEGVGHFPTREAADRVNKLLLEFLEK